MLFELLRVDSPRKIARNALCDHEDKLKVFRPSDWFQWLPKQQALIRERAAALSRVSPFFNSFMPEDVSWHHGNQFFLVGHSCSWLLTWLAWLELGKC